MARLVIRPPLSLIISLAALKIRPSIGDAPDDRLLKDSFSFEYHQGALRTVAAFLGAELEKNRETFAP